MTRINTIPVEHLTNEWLLAEFRELLRIPNKIITGKTKLCLKRIPCNYKMGTGHELFFHDKLKWLHARHDQLRLECIKRKININLEHKFDFDSLPEVAKMFFYNDWTPTEQDHIVNLERLQERFTLRKKAYTFTSVILYKNIKRTVNKLVIDHQNDFDLWLMRFNGIVK